MNVYVCMNGYFPEVGSQCNQFNGLTSSHMLSLDSTQAVQLPVLVNKIAFGVLYFIRHTAISLKCQKVSSIESRESDLLDLSKVSLKIPD